MYFCHFNSMTQNINFILLKGLLAMVFPLVQAGGCGEG